MQQELTSLQVSLLDEYYRCERLRPIYEEELAKCAKGKIYRRIVRYKIYYCLQWREGSRPKSKYIKKEDLIPTQKSIDKRKRLEKDLKHIKIDMQMIEKALGKKLIDARREGWGRIVED